MTATPIYTIGYGARDIEGFLKVLTANRIEYLIDVRSKPYSSYKPAFSKIALPTFLESKGVRYVFMGDSLGGRPDDPICYTDGKIDYEKIAQQPFYRQGIERLYNASRQNRRVVLMCSEGKPENCHRTKLIGQTLLAQGIEVQHINENDDIIPHDQVLLRLTKGQQPLVLPESPSNPALNLW